MSARLHKLIKESDASVDWTAVATVAHQPRGVVVAVSGPASSIDAVIAAAPLVQNRIPPGANWTGEDETPPDQPGFQQIMSEREPSTASAAPAPPVRPPASVPTGSPRG
jgi:hypothetical protein